MAKILYVNTLVVGGKAEKTASSDEVPMDKVDRLFGRKQFEFSENFKGITFAGIEPSESPIRAIIEIQPPEPLVGQFDRYGYYLLKDMHVDAVKALLAQGA